MRGKIKNVRSRPVKEKRSAAGGMKQKEKAMAAPVKSSKKSIEGAGVVEIKNVESIRHHREKPLKIPTWQGIEKKQWPAIGCIDNKRRRVGEVIKKQATIFGCLNDIHPMAVRRSTGNHFAFLNA